MLIIFHKIPCYHLNKRILWKLYLLYTDYLISQKYKKNSPAKYAKLLYLASSIRWISIMFDFDYLTFIWIQNMKDQKLMTAGFEGIESLPPKLQRNWVFATNSDFLIPIYLQTDVVDLSYFKIWFSRIHKVKC